MFLKTSKKLKYDIEIFYNIFSNYERQKILKQFIPKLCRNDVCPGMQTPPNLHLVFKEDKSYFDPFNIIKKRIKVNNQISKSWINYTDYNLKYLSWHTHASSSFDKTCVYMLENPEKVGTWFLVENQVYKVKAPTNSLILFSKDLIHTVPSDIKKPRYSLAIEFI